MDKVVGEAEMTKTELIELLKKARKQLKKYNVPKDEQTVTLSIDELEKVLSEQPIIVRCKDCKQGEQSVLPNRHLWCRIHEFYREPDWFCADGVKKDA